MSTDKFEELQRAFQRRPPEGMQTKDSQVTSTWRAALGSEEARLEFYKWMDLQPPRPGTGHDDDSVVWLAELKKMIEQANFNDSEADPDPIKIALDRCGADHNPHLKVRNLKQYYRGFEIGCQFTDGAINLGDDEIIDYRKVDCDVSELLWFESDLLAIRYIPSVQNAEHAGVEKRELVGFQMGRIAARDHPSPHVDPDRHWYSTGLILFLELQEDGRAGDLYVINWEDGDALYGAEIICWDEIGSDVALGDNPRLEREGGNLLSKTFLGFSLAKVQGEKWELLDGTEGREWKVTPVSLERAEFGEATGRKRPAGGLEFWRFYNSWPRTYR